MPRVVASLTTMPDRYHKVVETLKCLYNQTYKLDAIYLSLPYKSRRLGIDYPDPTSDMKKYATIVRCTDYGPITKIAGGLIEEKKGDTVIITFDDDMIYPENIVEKLVEKHKEYPNYAIGSSGMLLKYKCPMCAITPNEDTWIYRIPKFTVPAEGRKVDSIYGYPGALYVRKFFPSVQSLEESFFKYALIDHNTYMNDDIVISGYLSLTNVDRMIFPNMPIVGFVLNGEGTRSRSEHEISYDLDKFFQRMNLAIDIIKEQGMYQTTEPIYFSETIVGVAFMAILAILLIIACAVLYYRYM